MKHKVFFIAFFFSINLPAFQQNLVPNPSFEEYVICPVDFNFDNKAELVKDWYIPTKGTPDYFNSCSRFNVGVPVNAMGSTFAFDGKGYLGLIVLEKPDFRNFNRKRAFNYREYIQCKLTQPLKKDSLYLIKFMYSAAPFSTFVICNISANLSVEPVKSKKVNTLQLTHFSMTDSTALNNNPGLWYEATDTIKANGNELYLTIGNFENDSATNYKQLDFTNIPSTRLQKIIEDALAYYYIDAVSLTRINH